MDTCGLSEQAATHARDHYSPGEAVKQSIASRRNDTQSASRPSSVVTRTDRPRTAARRSPSSALSPVELATAVDSPATSALIPALARVAHFAQTYLQKTVLSTYGLDWNEFQVLRVVNTFPMIRSSQAATRIGLHRATLTGVVTRLEARNLLRRLESDDRIRVELVLTPRGADLWCLVSAAVAEHEREFVRKPAVRRALTALSDRIASIA